MPRSEFGEELERDGRGSWMVATRELDENHRLLTRRRDELSLQRGRLSGICERAALLDELERRNEGLDGRCAAGAGARAREPRRARFRRWSAWWPT